MYPPPYAPQDTRSLATQVSSVMKRVYIKMTLGLLVTAFISMWASQSYDYMMFIARTDGRYGASCLSSLESCSAFLPVSTS